MSSLAGWGISLSEKICSKRDIRLNSEVLVWSGRGISYLINTKTGENVGSILGIDDRIEIDGTVLHQGAGLDQLIIVDWQGGRFADGRRLINIYATRIGIADIVRTVDGDIVDELIILHDDVFVDGFRVAYGRSLAVVVVSINAAWSRLRAAAVERRFAIVLLCRLPLSVSTADRRPSRVASIALSNSDSLPFAFRYIHRKFPVASFAFLIFGA